MSDHAVRILGMMLSENARLEAMKAANAARELGGGQPKYDEQDFLNVANALQSLAQEV